MGESNIFSPEVPSGTAATTAAANLAQETGGNLAALVQLAQNMERLLEYMPLLIARLDAINLTLANSTGTSFVNPDDLLLVQ